LNILVLVFRGLEINMAKWRHWNADVQSNTKKKPSVEQI